MKIEIKVKWVLALIGVLALGIWLISSWVRVRHAAEIDRLSVALYDAERTVNQYRIQVMGLEETVAEQKTIILSSDKAIFQLKEESERLKALHIKDVRVIGKLEATVSVLKDSLVPKAPAVEAKPVWTSFLPEKVEKKPNVLPLPNQYSYTDRWVSLTNNINSGGIGSFEFNVTELPINVVLGTKKEGLFIKPTEVSAVTTPNPYVNLSVSEFAVVEDNRKSPLFYYAVGGGSVLVVVTLLSLVLQ